MYNKGFFNSLIRIQAILVILILFLWSSVAGAQVSRFIIGTKSFDSTQFSCDGHPGCYIEKYECKWDVTLCDRQCEILEPWNEDVDKCLDTCNKNASTIAAYEGFPEIQYSVIESFCVQYHTDNDQE